MSLENIKPPKQRDLLDDVVEALLRADNGSSVDYHWFFGEVKAIVKKHETTK
jgi:hypothetical protein